MPNIKNISGPIRYDTPGIYLWNPITDGDASERVCIWDRYSYNSNGIDENQLESAKLSMNVNSGGTLTIKVPYTNTNLKYVIVNWDQVGVGPAPPAIRYPMYVNYNCLAQWIRCYVILPNGDIWFGRPQSMSYDEKGTATIVFEGALSFLSDFIVNGYDYQEYYKETTGELHGGISIRDFVRVMVERADSQVSGLSGSDFRRVFQSTEAGAADERVYPVSDTFQTIYDALIKGVVELSRGYFSSSFEYNESNARYYQYVYFKYYKAAKSGLVLPKEFVKSQSKGVDFTEDTWMRLAPFGSKIDNSEKRYDITGVEATHNHPAGSIWVSSNPNLNMYPINEYIKDIVTVAEIFEGVTDPQILYKLADQIVRKHSMLNATKKFNMKCLGWYKRYPGLPADVEQGDVRIGDYYTVEDLKKPLDCIKVDYDLLNPANDSYEFEEHIS